MIFKRTLIYLLLIISSVTCSKSPTEPDSNFTGWEVVPPQSQSMNPVILDALTDKIESGQMGLISSLLIVRNKKIVYEEYFRDMTDVTLHNIYSVTKSFTSAMIGIALREGKINSIADKIYGLFPEYDTFQNMTPYKDSITIEHLLQMRAGYRWDEISIPYGMPENSFTQMYASDDVVKFVLDRPLSDIPGSTFVYNTGASMLLGGIIRNSYEYDVQEFANRVLFVPLGITRHQWVQIHNGFIPTGTGLKLTPRDMAKFGLLYLQNGIWNGDTLVPTEWIQQSHQPYSRFTSGNGYGYHWWLRELHIKGSTYLVPEAMGYGNQYIFVIHPLNMVVVSTAENYENFTGFIEEILNNYIIPSVY